MSGRGANENPSRSNDARGPPQHRRHTDFATSDPCMNLKKLDLNLLVVFEAVYSAANISHAAARLGMSQSAVSGALTRLRSLLKDPLFVPARRGVEATVKAQRMIAPVREALGIIKAQLNDGQ